MRRRPPRGPASTCLLARLPARTLVARFLITSGAAAECFCRDTRGMRILGGGRAAGEVIVTTRLGLAAVAALLGATAGCNLILGTTPPLPLGTGGTGMGGTGAGGTGA